ncbi:MAG: DNA polymerase III subunit delta, partial [Thermovirgaceae bacterium]
MTHFIAVTGSGPSQRALLAECMKELRGKGFETFERFSGESWQDLFGVLNTGGLFEEKRPFVVEGSDQLGPFPEGALDGL